MFVRQGKCPTPMGQRSKRKEATRPQWEGEQGQKKIN